MKYKLVIDGKVTSHKYETKELAEAAKTRMISALAAAGDDTKVEVKEVKK